MREKIKGRIRRLLTTGREQSRVYLRDGVWGVYRLKHHVTEIPFRVDRLGRIFLYEG